MATYVSNRNSDGKTDENGHFRLPLKMMDGEVFSGFDVTTAGSPSMQVIVTAGEIKIPYDDYAYACWSDEDTTIDIPTSSSSNNRVDKLVAYVDRGMTFSEGDINNPGALKIVDVTGNPGNPATAPTDIQIQSAVGAGNPYVELATISVPLGATAIYSGNIDTSAQKHVSLSPNVQVNGVTGTDGKRFKFVVIPESQSNKLPSPEPDTTIVAFITKGN